MIDSTISTTETQKANASEFPTAHPNLSFDLVTDVEGLRALEPAWRTLESNTPQSFTYFQTYDWCAGWYSVFGATNDDDTKPQARIFTASERGEPVLIWPLMVEQGPMGLNTLSWLTWPHGQYGNVMAEPGERAEAAIAACWGHIKRLPRIDTIELPDIPASSALAKVLFAEEESTGADNLSSIMDLARFDTVQDYVDTWSKSARRSRGRRQRKLASHGELEFSVVEGGTPAFRSAVADALKMKDVWLANTGKVSRALSMPGTKAFLSALPVSPGKAGRALAGVLSLDGKAVSVEIGFERGGDYVSYLGAFDWELRGYSPGKIEMDMMLRWAIENGMNSYDLLGNASSYKDDWSNIEVPLLSHVVAQSVLGIARTELWVKRLRPALKNTLDGLPDDKRRMLVSAVGANSNASVASK